MTRYLLCRPQGGLNDILCQIEKCCRYAERTGRVLLIDTNYEHASFFHDRFSNYFSSRQNGIVLDAENFPDSLNNMDVFPMFLSGRIDKYKTSINLKNREYCDTETDLPVTFDFDRDYPHTLLVHHNVGGCTLSLYALLRLRLRDTLTDELLTRLNCIGSPYTGIHIRNTDYKTNYEQFLRDFRPQPNEAVFLATDNRGTLEEFQQTFGRDRIFSFASLPATSNPIHSGKQPPEEQFVRNRDAILDLLMLALSHKLYLFKLEENHIGARYSGFSRLAQELWESKIVLKHLISRPEIHFGLD
jgi:hypothetical protein